MRTAFRSVATVNRQAMTGTAIIVALSAALLTAAGAWLQAGIFNPELFQLTAIAASFAGTVLMLTIFIVASTMGSAIHARRAEFALLRAIGSTNSQIRRSISNEALVITGLMGPIGILLGFILAPLVSPLMKAAGILPATFDLGWSPLVALGTLAFLTPTALVAGRLSARGVLAVSPTAALRDSTHELAGPLSADVRSRQSSLQQQDLAELSPRSFSPAQPEPPRAPFQRSSLCSPPVLSAPYWCGQPRTGQRT